MLTLTTKVVSIPKEEYCLFLSLQSQSAASSTTVILAQTCAVINCLATQEPWFIYSGVTDRMNLGSFSLPRGTLADRPNTTIFGLGNANLTLTLSLSSVFYVISESVLRVFVNYPNT